MIMGPDGRPAPGQKMPPGAPPPGTNPIEHNFRVLTDMTNAHAKKILELIAIVNTHAKKNLELVARIDVLEKLWHCRPTKL